MILERILNTYVFVFLLFSFLTPCQGQISDLFNGVELSNSVAEVQDKIEGLCQYQKIQNPSSASFPLAENEESHLICEGFSIYDGYFRFSEVAFVFSDDRLSYIEVHGDGVNKLIMNEFYPGYRFFVGADKMIVNKEQMKAWFLSPEGLHTNLFAWSNPYLPSNGGVEKEYEKSAIIPEVFRFGATLEDLQPDLEKYSDFIHLQNFLNEESQLNCFGVEYAGFKRKIEAKFNKEGLYMLWILTAKSEENRIRKALIKAYSKPVFTNEKWEVFNDWKVSIRKDKPEVLVLSSEMVANHKKNILSGNK